MVIFFSKYNNNIYFNKIKNKKFFKDKEMLEKCMERFHDEFGSGGEP